MRKILGLDLGSASVGWAVVTEREDNIRIEALGSRIIPLSTDDANEFTKGKAISKNASRTQRRTQRKGYDRYQQRRENLTKFLRKHDLLPNEELIKLEKLLLWELRAKAVSEQLSLSEIGRVLYHINQKRGYKAIKADYDPDADKKQGEYVKTVMGRHKDIVERGITIGQFFFEELCSDSAYRTKEQVFPRRAYEEEFDRIIACQRKFYPDVFTDKNIEELRNQIIFYQRGLKSCKHLVSICEFEKRKYINSNGKEVFDGPKVAPRSSPLAQVCKIWESVNNLTLKNRKGETLEITPTQRRAMFKHLDDHEKLTLTDMYRILGISKSDGWWGGKAIGKGLQGNTTKMAIRKALGEGYDELLHFELSKTDTDIVDTETGEIVQIISDRFQYEPLYRLWHMIYSIEEKKEFENTCKKQFGIDDPEVMERLYTLDFVKAGYANKSAKAIRRILPYLEQGLIYSKACGAAGFRHSESLNKEENQARELQKKLPPVEKNELRQPVVEKILNQMINVVNALMERHGQFNEIRVELARDLKQSREERNETTKAINKAERENKDIADRIRADYFLTPTRSRIQKYKMWLETGHKCIYCGQTMNVTEFLKGFDVEVEHIIPRSLFFDDGFSNKVCACRKCNSEKGQRTAYDYMRSKSDGEFSAYLERIEKLYKEGINGKKISKTKYERLLTPADKIPTDFIDRQLRETQYIARKSREILSSVCRDVTSTSGSVTDFIRRVWGWDKILHNLNFERYKLAGLTEIKVREHKNNGWSEEVIKDWSKRLDHRHHAIDALVVACAKQGYIQRINNMSELKDVNFGSDEKQGAEYRERKTKLERYIESQPHFTTTEVEKMVDTIFVSFKAGKKAASTGKRYVHRCGKRKMLQRDIIVPRGALHEETIYGSLKQYEVKKNRAGVKTVSFKTIYTIRKEVSPDLKIDKVIDKGTQRILEARLAEFGGDAKKAFSNLDVNPIWLNKDKGIAIKRVTISGISNAVSLRDKRDKDGRLILDENGNKQLVDFVNTGNNHHIAIYVDKDGNRHESCVIFWQAVERKKHRIPIVITRPDEVWDNLPQGLPEDFLAELPNPDWSFEVSLQQNEMFILGLEPEAFEESLHNKDYALLSKYLYRVQKIQKGDYWFRHHLQTKVDDISLSSKNAGIFQRYSLKSYLANHPQKVSISILGEITKV